MYAQVYIKNKIKYKKEREIGGSSYIVHYWLNFYCSINARQVILTKVALSGKNELKATNGKTPLTCSHFPKLSLSPL